MYLTLKLVEHTFKNVMHGYSSSLKTRQNKGMASKTMLSSKNSNNNNNNWRSITTKNTLATHFRGENKTAEHSYKVKGIFAWQSQKSLLCINKRIGGQTGYCRVQSGYKEKKRRQSSMTNPKRLGSRERPRRSVRFCIISYPAMLISKEINYTQK